jgi:hypothetical protein
VADIELDRKIQASSNPAATIPIQQQQYVTLGRKNG